MDGGPGGPTGRGKFNGAWRAPGAVELLQCLAARKLSEFKEKEPGSLRLASALRAMTQLRTLDPDGSMDLDFVGPLAGGAGPPHPLVFVSRPAQQLRHHCLRALGPPWGRSRRAGSRDSTATASGEGG